MPASSSMILISVLLITAGVLMLIGSIVGIAGLLFWESCNKCKHKFSYKPQHMVMQCLKMLLMTSVYNCCIKLQVSFGLWTLGFFIVIGVGIGAAVLTRDVSISYTQHCINSLGMHASLQEYLNWHSPSNVIQPILCWACNINTSITTANIM